MGFWEKWDFSDSWKCESGRVQSGKMGFWNRPQVFIQSSLIPKRWDFLTRILRNVNLGESYLETMGFWEKWDFRILGNVNLGSNSMDLPIQQKLQPFGGLLL